MSLTTIIGRKTGAVLLAATVVSVGASAVPAFAGTSASASHGSAVVKSGQVTPFTVKNVSGGTWNYGSYGTFTRHCYSHYVHPSHQHTATAIIGAKNVKVSRAPRVWANADDTGGFFDSCATYYSVL